MTLLELQRFAELEYGDIVVDSQILGEKLRLFLMDASSVDIWLSRQLHGRFGFHWERRHLDGTLYRYDNFPNSAWQDVATYLRHFHRGTQDAVEAAPFAERLPESFREFVDLCDRLCDGRGMV